MRNPKTNQRSEIWESKIEIQNRKPKSKIENQISYYYLTIIYKIRVGDEGKWHGKCDKKCHRNMKQ